MDGCLVSFTYFPCKDVVHDPTWNNHEKAGSLGYRVPGSNLKFQQTGFCCFLRGMKHHSNDLTKNKEPKTTEKRKTKKNATRSWYSQNIWCMFFLFSLFWVGPPTSYGGIFTHSPHPKQHQVPRYVFCTWKNATQKSDVSKNPRFRGVFRKDGDSVTFSKHDPLGCGMVSDFTRQIKVNMSNIMGM